MIKKQELNKSETFRILVPVSAGWKCPNQFHQLTIVCSADCNAGFIVNTKIKPMGSPGYENTTDGSLTASDYAGEQKTMTISSGGNGILLEGIEVSITGRTAGSVSVYYVGFGAEDTGEEYSAA